MRPGRYPAPFLPVALAVLCLLHSPGYSAEPSARPFATASATPAAPKAPGAPAAEAGFHLEKWPPDSLLRSRRTDSSALEDLAAYVEVRAAGFGEWADTGLYIGTQMGRHPQVHQVAAPGADRRQVTFFPRRMSGFHFNPVPERKNLLYTEDAGGDEQFRLRLFDMRTGRGRDLGCPPGRVEDPVWNDSGTRFAYSHTPKGTDRWDLRMGGVEGADTLLLSREGTWTPLDISPDGRRLLVRKYTSATHAEVFILSLGDGTLSPLLPGEQGGYVEEAVWIKAPDPAVAFTSDRGGEFRRLYLVRPGDSTVTPLSEAAPWDVEWASPDRERRSLVYALNEEGVSRLFSVEAASGKKAPRARALTGIPAGIIGGVRFRPGSSREFAFTLNSAAFPGDVFTYAMAKQRATRWTFSETGGLPRESFTVPELVRYPTFDSVPIPGAVTVPAPAAGTMQRRTIPAWYYPPSKAAHPSGGNPSGGGPARRPAPVLILVHGGPELQARAGFDPFLQFAAGRLGMAIVQPNVRGSSGYGKSWLKADDGYLRMNSVRDLGALLEWIRTRPELDPERVAVAGRSYGGFMALSALIEYGGSLRAGISTVGITHFPSFLAKTSGYRRDLRRAEYGDERIPAMAAFLDGISPLTRLNRLNTPLLLCHGRNDPRVPYAESERIFAALKTRKVPVWFMTFDEEGHAVRDRESLLALYSVMARFLTQQIGSSP